MTGFVTPVCLVGSTTLLRARWEAEGLMPLLHQRANADELERERWRATLERADLLAVGSLADCVRHSECGDELRVYLAGPPAPSAGVCVVGSAEDALQGVTVLRKIALLRLLGDRGQRIVVDWTALGWDLAQVAIRFGATDLAGPVAAPRARPERTGGRRASSLDERGPQTDRAVVQALAERNGLNILFVESEESPARRSPPEEST